ncbi:oxidoreductase [bacterium]|nr:oxidoreductase [bacterium]
MSKPKVAFYWCASCGGCEEAVVDLAEDILKVVEAVEIVLWPVALDFKRKDVEAMADGEIAVSFINGAVRTEEQLEMVELLRRKSQMVVAFGSCAHIGGIPGLANFSNRKGVFERVYHTSESTSNPSGVVPKTRVTVPEGELTLPEFFDTVNTLDQVIDVDYYLPGCAPPADLIMDAVTAILEGNLPPKGTVLASKKSLCDECDRNDSKPEKLQISELKRVHLTEVDPEKCFLAQGIICLGMVTRGGCGQRCVNANMPCRGCFGPTDEVKDFGLKAMSSIASIFNIEGEKDMSEEETQKLIDSIVDPAGLFYMYNLPSSILRRRKMED